MRQISKFTFVVIVLAASFLILGNSTFSSGIGTLDVRSTFVCAQMPIATGESVNGSLENGDCVDTSTALYDAYTFTATAGERVNIAVSSQSFAATLRLVQGSYPGGTLLATGSDAGNGTRQINGFAIPTTGNYTVVISSTAAGGMGGYTVSLEPSIPRVDLIQRTSPNPALPGTIVGYSVFFSSSVTGVDPGDFVLTTTGISGSAITNVSGSGSIYTVAINTGSAPGTLRLDLIDNDTIVNSLGVPLGGVGTGNGNFTAGPTYTVANPTPTPSPTPPQNTVVVTNTSDDGEGSLRRAIADVASGGTVSFSTLFDSPQTITLESELRVIKNLTINGPGPNLLTVSGNNAVRVFNIGGSSPGETVSISGITITGGRAPNDDFGGGIEKNFGSLTLSNCVIAGNNIAGNGESGSGAGVDNFQGPLTITECEISGNTANGFGGGVLSDGGNLTISDSTISGNNGFSGAGIVSINGLTLITGTTISGNTAVSQGGGAFILDSALTLVSSTVSGNNATVAGAGLILLVSEGTHISRLTSSTIANNIAPANSGGGVLVSGTAAAVFRGTVIASNTEPNLRAQNSSASIISEGFNLTDSSSSSFLNQPSDILNTAPGLAPLANNGGPTQTHALLATSPAIDAGSSFGLSNDQRGAGFLRIADLSPANASGGDGADIGAFEAQAEPGPTFAAISGRVFTPGGLFLRNANVTLIDPQGVRRTATTSSFGVFSFPNAATGRTYIVTVNSKRYRFAARTVELTGDLSNVDFIGLE